MKISSMVCALGWVSSFVLAWAWLLEFVNLSWLSFGLFTFFVISGTLGGFFSTYEPARRSTENKKAPSN